MSEEDKLFFGVIVTFLVGIVIGLLLTLGFNHIDQRRTDNYCQTVPLEQMDMARCGL